MAYTFEYVSIKGMRATHFEQLMTYLEDREREGWYYGNKEQFESRHEDLKGWLQMIIDEAKDPENRIPK